jgi:hypothetical protein
MIKHIVFWKLKEGITGSERDDVLKRIKDGFEAMQGKIPGLLTIELGITFSEGAESADFCLYSEFDSRASLEGYNIHPLHQAMVSIVREVRVERRVADYTI